MSANVSQIPSLLIANSPFVQYCSNGELAIKSEGMEDTFKDIAVYSTLAMILFRKSENLKELQGKKWTPVDDKYNGDESYEHPMIAMREAAEKQQEEEEELNYKDFEGLDEDWEDFNST